MNVVFDQMTVLFFIEALLFHEHMSSCTTRNQNSSLYITPRTDRTQSREQVNLDKLVPNITHSMTTPLDVPFHFDATEWYVKCKVHNNLETDQ